MKGKVLFDAFGYIDDRYLDIADAPRKELYKMKSEKEGTIKRKAFTVLLAAAICVSLLAVTAVAAGWVPGIFAQLQEQIPEEQELFAAAAEANTEAVPEVREIPELDLSKLVLLERYYDGETILLGYDLEKVLPEAVIVQPEEELLKEIKRGNRVSQIGRDSEQPWAERAADGYAVQHNFREDGYLMDRMLKGALSEEDYEQAWKLMEQQGYVCIAVWDIYIGDHVLVNGHDTFEAYDSETNPYAGQTEYSAEQGVCLRLEPLPEEGRNQDKVTVTLKVKSTMQYWYLDMYGNGRIYFDSSNTKSEEVSFELERSERND